MFLCCSLQCQSFGAVVLPDRTFCSDPNNGGKNTAWGMAHARYDCNTKSLWVLTYVFNNTNIVFDQNGLWIDTNCGTCSSGGGGSKTAKFDSSFSGCAARLPATSARREPLVLPAAATHAPFAAA